MKIRKIMLLSICSILVLSSCSKVKLSKTKSTTTVETTRHLDNENDFDEIALKFSKLSKSSLEFFSSNCIAMKSISTRNMDLGPQKSESFSTTFDPKTGNQMEKYSFSRKYPYREKTEYEKEYKRINGSDIIWNEENQKEYEEYCASIDESLDFELYIKKEQDTYIGYCSYDALNYNKSNGFDINYITLKNRAYSCLIEGEIQISLPYNTELYYYTTTQSLDYNEGNGYYFFTMTKEAQRFEILFENNLLKKFVYTTVDGNRQEIQYQESTLTIEEQIPNRIYLEEDFTFGRLRFGDVNLLQPDVNRFIQ